MERNHLQKLVFVYNANSGLKNKILDGAHKILRPDTYACNLCDITFGAFTELKVWKRFRETSKITMEFLYKDGFVKAYRSKFGYKFTFPIVLAVTQDNLEVFIKTEELNALEDARGLMDLVRDRLRLFSGS